VIGFTGRDQITKIELAERLQIQHHSSVGLVDRLEDQGYDTPVISSSPPGTGAYRPGDAERAKGY
jgi:hypothetical protein